MIVMSGNRFRAVNGQNPCPVCSHTDWCTESDDLVVCRRESTSSKYGVGKPKIDVSGERYHIFLKKTDEARDPRTC
jgi:hypothetical protein